MTKAVQSLNHVVLMGIRPEQDFTGYVVQESTDLIEWDSAMNSYIGDVKDLKLNWFEPGGIAAISRLYPKTLGDVKSVIYRHTCYPLFKVFMAPDKAETLYEFHINGDSDFSRAHRFRHEWPLKARLAICPDCFDEDVENFGYPIRRRLHLVGGIFACHVHKRTLLASCGVCRERPRTYKHLWDVQKQCGCTRPLKEVEQLTGQELGVAISVASMAQQILDGYDTRTITTDKIARAIRIKAHELSENPYQFLLKALRHSLGIEGMARMKLFEGSLHSFTRENYRRSQNPVFNLTVIYVVFGSLDELIRYIKIHDSALSGEIKSLDTSSPVIDSAKVERRTKSYRKWLEDQLRVHPNMHRFQLKKLPRGGWAVNHLRKYDKEYFDERVPILTRQHASAQIKKTMLEQREKLHAIRVAELVEHVEEQYRHMLSTQPTERICKWHLLNDAANTNVPGIMNDPEVKLALERCSDNRKSWLVRKAEVLCARVSQLSKTSRYAALSTFLNSKNLDTFQAKIYYVEKWLQQEIEKSSAPS